MVQRGLNGNPDEMYLLFPNWGSSKFHGRLYETCFARREAALPRIFAPPPGRLASLGRSPHGPAERQRLFPAVAGS